MASSPLRSSVRFHLHLFSPGNKVALWSDPICPQLSPALPCHQRAFEMQSANEPYRLIFRSGCVLPSGAPHIHPISYTLRVYCFSNFCGSTWDKKAGWAKCCSRAVSGVSQGWCFQVLSRTLRGLLDSPCFNGKLDVGICSSESLVPLPQSVLRSLRRRWLEPAVFRSRVSRGAPYDAYYTTEIRAFSPIRDSTCFKLNSILPFCFPHYQRRFHCVSCK